MQCLSYLLKRLDSLVSVPSGVMFEIIPVEYLGGPYPCIGMYAETNRDGGADLTCFAFDIEGQLEAFIQKIGIDQLLESSFEETLRWQEILRRFPRAH